MMKKNSSSMELHSPLPYSFAWESCHNKFLKNVGDFKEYTSQDQMQKSSSGEDGKKRGEVLLCISVQSPEDLN